MRKILNISIVLYNSNFEEIDNLVRLLNISDYVNSIFLIDNSSIKNLLFENCNAQYIFNNENLGYGAGHNLAIKKSIQSGVLYHLVLNSDISFDNKVLPTLIKKMDDEHNWGMIMPKVLNIDESVQFLPKLLPTPFNLVIRVTPILRKLFDLVNEKYTLRRFSDVEMNVPIISGCFSFFRVKALKEVGLYDESFFMYFEDFDISRKVHSKYKTIYYPEVSVIHAHERGAAKNFKLFKVFISSAIIYFNKYGWFFDKERKRINTEVLNQIR